MKCKFEEKQFEKLIDAELFGPGRLFPMGQVLEGVLGFDSAGFIRSRPFWRRFRPGWPPPWWLPGVYPNHDLWDISESVINSDAFPKFKCNVFLQYKRPEYISSRRGREYPDWNSPYFRYEIDLKQQRILDQLETKVSSSALVLYACPAFWKYRQLWDYGQAASLIDNSNFCKPSFLTGHRRYTFVDSGTSGKAYSEPNEIKVVNFKEELDKLLRQENRFLNNKDFILKLEQSLSELYPAINYAYKIDIAGNINEMKGEPMNKLLKALMKISLFTFVTQLTWMIGCAIKEET